MEEVLSLKEMLCRKLIKMVEKDHQLRQAVQSVAELKHLLSQVGLCAICNGPFINSWLDCVEFVPANKIFPLQHNTHILPLRVVLCSYHCFTNNDHQFYGIATPVWSQ
jgi:hypothetical protein